MGGFPIKSRQITRKSVDCTIQPFNAKAVIPLGPYHIVIVSETKDLCLNRRYPYFSTWNMSRPKQKVQENKAHRWAIIFSTLDSPSLASPTVVIGNSSEMSPSQKLSDR